MSHTWCTNTAARGLHTCHVQLLQSRQVKHCIRQHAQAVPTQRKGAQGAQTWSGLLQPAGQLAHACFAHPAQRAV